MCTYSHSRTQGEDFPSLESVNSWKREELQGTKPPPPKKKKKSVSIQDWHIVTLLVDFLCQANYKSRPNCEQEIALWISKYLTMYGCGYGDTRTLKWGEKIVKSLKLSLFTWSSILIYVPIIEFKACYWYSLVFNLSHLMDAKLLYGIARALLASVHLQGTAWCAAHTDSGDTHLNWTALSHTSPENYQGQILGLRTRKR